VSTEVRPGTPGTGVAAPTTDWSRIAALGGVLFFIMLLIAFFAPAGAPPNVDDSTKTITNWYIKHHTGIMIADFFQALGIFPFLFFVASLWRTVRRAEGSGVMAVVVATGGAVGATLAIIAFAAESAVTFQAAKRWIGWAGLVTAAVMLVASLGVFADKSNVLNFLGLIAFILFALWVLATSIVLYLRPPTATLLRIETS